MESHFKQIGDRNVHYYVGGEPGKPTLICFHGLTGSSESFLELAEYLKNDFHIYLFDQPGHGQTDPFHEENDYLFSSMAHYYKELFKEILLNKPFYLVGHSWGGDTGLHYASCFPKSVKGLIMLDGGFTFPHYQEDMSFKKTSEAWEDFIEHFTFNSYEEMFNQYKLYTRRWNSKLEKVTLATFQKTSPYQLISTKETCISIIRAFFQEPFYEAYTDVKCPLLLIHASEPAELHEARKKGIRALQHDVKEVKVIEWQGGHNLHWDDPQGIGECIMKFVQKIEDRNNFFHVTCETKGAE
ncbi:alpha/beta fold hydrolase [Rossellomorea aquimaris]|uniref:alpha/beta fold hydrolase n=1 Tax=Rossellomorea aquimaris TaxID=189382 RepID=UPI0007D0ADEE|nr:alpha/beta hydrolase [Rossellomorea aquimaris]